MLQMDHFKTACQEMTANSCSNLHSQRLKTMELNDQKAGMSGLDKDHINKVIYNATKGTPYFMYQQKRQQRIDDRIQEIQRYAKTISEEQKLTARKKMDTLAAKLEAEMRHSRVIVHFDMDAFFVAVEIRDNPSLRDKAVAVGSNYMLSTSNYEARKFGVRAAMPGFIAKKLCSHLIIVPPNYDKYRKVSKDVFNILKNYDENFLPMSLDEAYVDLSDYMQKLCLRHEAPPYHQVYTCWEVSKEFDIVRDMIDNIVKEIRAKIFETTGLTASAGIGPNMMLAKICSDQNKPNGQFRVPPGTKEMQNFISALPVRKVSGIGPVQEQILRSLGITSCQHLWEKRDMLALLFTPTTSKFYLRVALGLGLSELKSDYERKSKGVELTFQALSDVQDLHAKCQELCLELCKDLKASHVKGKVVVLKIKTVEYEVHTRNMSLLCYTSDDEAIFKAAKSLLDSEIALSQPNPLQLRLMGVRMCNLVEENSLENRKIQQPTIFHSLKRLEKQEKSHLAASNSVFVCPVCNQSQSFKNLENFNVHLDNCLGLNKQTERVISFPPNNEDAMQNYILDSTIDMSEQLPHSFCENLSSIGHKISCESEVSSINDSGIYTNDYEFSGSVNNLQLDNIENGINNENSNCPNETNCVSSVIKINSIDHSNDEQLEADRSKMICPICCNSSSQDLQQLNQHIDICLNKPLVKELLSQTVAENGEKRKQPSSQSNQSKKLKTVDKSCRKIEEFFY